MKSIYISYYTILRNLRDYTNSMLMLLFPIVLVFIYGVSLSGSFQIENMKPLKVVLANENSGGMAEVFENYIKRDEIREILEVEEANSFQDGINKVKLGEASALIYVKRDFTGEIKVYKGDISAFKYSVIKNVVDGFAESINAQYAYLKMGKQISDIKKYQNVKDVGLRLDGKTPRAIDYYAVSMLIMSMMYGTMHGSHAMFEERLYKTEVRLKSAPVNNSDIFIGKVLGTILAIMLNGIIIIFFTKYVYGVYWGSNIMLILLVCFTLSVLAVALGVASLMVIGKENRTQAFLMVLIPILTFLGGGYVPTQYLPSIIKKIRFISPNYLAQDIIFNIIYQGSPSQTFTNLLILWTASIVLFFVSAFMGRRDIA